MVLKGHEPFPAIAVDRHWTLIAANASIAPLLSAVSDQSLLTPPVNVLRLSLPIRWARHSERFLMWGANPCGCRLRRSTLTGGVSR
ncbi:transcriptional regulator, partial [Rhizobium johnstonii]